MLMAITAAVLFSETAALFVEKPRLSHGGVGDGVD